MKRFKIGKGRHATKKVENHCHKPSTAAGGLSSTPISPSLALSTFIENKQSLSED